LTFDLVTAKVTFRLLTAKVDLSSPAPQNTCANLQQNWFIRLQNITFTTLEMDGQTDGQTDRETDGQVENTCASLDWWRYNKGYKQPEIDTLKHINLNIQNDNLLAPHLAEHQTECTGSFLSLTNSALLAYSIPQSTPQARSEMTQGTTNAPAVSYHLLILHSLLIQFHSPHPRHAQK